jgi:hypothetical protein
MRRCFPLASPRRISLSAALLPLLPAIVRTLEAPPGPDRLQPRRMANGTVVQTTTASNSREAVAFRRRSGHRLCRPQIVQG